MNYIHQHSCVNNNILVAQEVCSIAEDENYAQNADNKESLAMD